MTNSDREWTDVDLDRLRQLDAGKASVADIAEALQRSQADIEDRLGLVRARAPGPVGPDEEGDVPPPRHGTNDAAAWVHANSSSPITANTMSQKMGGLEQTIEIADNASRVNDDEVTIAADDAGATAAAQKIGSALEEEQPDIATRELRESDDRTQQATSLIDSGGQDAASREVDRELIRQADENAELTDEQMRKSGFGDHKGTKGF